MAMSEKAQQRRSKNEDSRAIHNAAITISTIA